MVENVMARCLKINLSEQQFLYMDSLKNILYILEDGRENEMRYIRNHLLPTLILSV